MNGVPLTEFCVMHPSYPDEPHRGPMSLQEATAWVEEAERDGMRTGAFYVASRTVSPWSPITSTGAEWVVGWGSTRHIPHPALADAQGRTRGLCGAYGGNRDADAARRPTCKRCAALSAKGIA